MAKKVAYFILLALLISNHLFSQTNQEKAISKQVVLQSNYPFVYCGGIMFAYGLRFKLVDSSAFIVGIVPCPEQYGKDFFVMNKGYSIEIVSSSQLDSVYSLENPYEKLKLPTYLITKISKHN